MLNKKELIQLLSSNPHSICEMSYEQLKDTLGNDIANMYQYNQENPHHCYDLLTHSIYSVVHLKDTQNDEYIQNCLLTAALFHDVGKVHTAFYKNGTKHFYGHAIKSREIAKPILENMGFDKEEVLRICFYICHHDDFISLHDINESSVLKIVNKMIQKEKELYSYDITIDHFISLMDLCYADASSQSEDVYKDGKLINSKLIKQEKTNAIKNILVHKKKSIF